MAKSRGRRRAKRSKSCPSGQHAVKFPGKAAVCFKNARRRSRSRKNMTAPQRRLSDASKACARDNTHSHTQRSHRACVIRRLA
ncbi:MAG: hypothetical protein Q7R39_00800 [Dehalococcoidia bacterium]|nr:hypothetical protein [Dehalococcoidia bacterium]